MAINFPSNPEVNDTWSYNGKIWTWDGDSWIASIESSISSNYLSDFEITTPTNQQLLEYDSVTNKWKNSDQIQSDWDQATSTALDFIKNKPTIPAAQIQSDWNQGSNTQPDYIKNKPSIPTNLNSLSNVVITSVSSGQVLKWDGNNWINDTDAVGTSISSINDIADVTITNATDGQVLKFNGTNWVNGSDNTGTGGGGGGISTGKAIAMAMIFG